MTWAAESEMVHQISAKKEVGFCVKKKKKKEKKIGIGFTRKGRIFAPVEKGSSRYSIILSLYFTFLLLQLVLKKRVGNLIKFIFMFNKDNFEEYEYHSRNT